MYSTAIKSLPLFDIDADGDGDRRDDGDTYSTR